MTIPNNILSLDYECNGLGWVYAYHNPNYNFKVCGCAVKEPGHKAYYTTDMVKVLDLVDKYKTMLAHNTVYDFGVLTYLKKLHNHSVNLKEVILYDTKLMYKIFDNTLNSYSLDSLSKQFLGKPKGYGLLIQLVKDLDLYPYTKKEMKEKNTFEQNNPDQKYIRKDVPDNKLLDFAYTHMELLHDIALQKVGEYAILDIEETWELFEKVYPHVLPSLLDDINHLLHIVTDYRVNGLRIDTRAARTLSRDLELEIIQDYKELTGIETSLDDMKLINSNKQLQELFENKGLDIPIGDSGKASFTKEYLRASKVKEIELIAKLRKNMKFKSSFVDTLLEYQKDLGKENGDFGLVCPEFSPYAADTTRFTCNRPNVQQQLPEVRRLFLPLKEGEQIHSLDFSNQEGRLQIHYAKLLNCPGIDEVVDKFHQDPKFDLHWKICKLMNLTCKEGSILPTAKPHTKTCDKCKKGRDIAKTIYLGLSYGMGKKKLADQLNLDIDDVIPLLNQFHKVCPFLKPLMKMCENSYKKNGYIKTLKGQKLKIRPENYGTRIDIPYYKALNVLIQGNAAEQTREAMIQAYKENIPVIITLHDELLISGTKEQALRLKEIMENCVKLVIPSFTEIISGNNWGEASK